MSHLTKNQVSELNEKYGWFQNADAQSDVSNAFANEAVSKYLQIRDNAPLLLDALISLMNAIELVEGHQDILHGPAVFAARAIKEAGGTL